MTWTAAALALTPTILLLVQGISCLMRRQQAPYVRRFGLLSILLSGMGFLTYLLLATDSLVLSPEFGIVMAQGPMAWVGMALLLIGLAISGGLGLLVQRLRTRPQIHLLWYLAVVTAVLVAGILAISRLWALNPDDSMLFRIYAYDVWWPSILIWLSVCLSESIAAIVGLRHSTARLWLAMALVTGLALPALSRPVHGAPSSQGLWQAYLLGVLPTTMSVIGWRLLLPRGRGPAQPDLQLRQALILVPAVVGLLNGLLWLWIRQSPGTTISWPEVWFWVRGIELHSETVTGQHVWEWSLTQWLWLMTWWSWLLWLVWPVLIGLVLPHRLHHGRRQRGVTWRLPPKLTSRRRILLYAIIGLALSLASLFSMVSIGRAVALVVERSFVLAFDPTLPFSIDRTLAMVGFMIAWTVLAEIIAGGPLMALLRHMTDRGLWAAVSTWVTEGSARVASWLNNLKRRRTVSDESGKEPVGSWLKSLMSRGFSVVGVALAAVVLLVVLNELPEAGKTMIQPFKVYVFPEHDNLDKSVLERDELGQAMSERVVHTFNRLRQVLQQEIVLSLKPDEEDAEGKVKLTLISAGNSTNFGGTALGKSAEVEFSGVKMPLGAIASPVRNTLRWLLGGRVINGSVQPEDLQGYVLLANSSAGESWKADFSTDKPSRAGALIPPAAVANLASQLAFNIISTDPTLGPLVTKSRGAFEAFREGLGAWKQFEAKQDYAALSRAIEQFRVATLLDAEFAFAHYRLGLALQRDGQPGAAAIAFRSGLQANPSLIPAYVALASILYDFDRQYYPGAVGLPLAHRRSLEVRQERLQEAHHLWLQILQFPSWAVSVPNQAAAYYGLCREAMQRARKEMRRPAGREASDQAATERRYYLPYYYCKQAAALYSRLPASQHAASEIKTGEASTLHTLGVVLASIREDDFKGNEPRWNCSSKKLRHSLYARYSLRYHLKAYELLPHDHRIRCHAARAAYVLGHSYLMERLDADPATHMSLATTYRKAAKRRAYDKPSESGRQDARALELYSMALAEYEKVITLDPTNIEALTGYANTFWEWQVNRFVAEDLNGPDSETEVDAEVYALRAVALVNAKPDPLAEGMTHSALGKVLLVQTRSTEAVRQLEAAIGRLEEVVGFAGSHPEFHEAHWALVQATRCVAVDGRMAGHLKKEHVQVLEKRAADLTAKIRQLELGREFRPYTELLDRWGLSVCNPEPGRRNMLHADNLS
jgi:tetratricopeptide (TPR) repeat protein